VEKQIRRFAFGWIAFTFSTLFSLTVQAQQSTLKGILQDAKGNPAAFATAALLQLKDSVLVKAAVANEAGVFIFQNIPAGQYRLKSSYVGLPTLLKSNVNVLAGQVTDLGILTFGEGAATLEEVQVTAQRRMVEVQPDRIAFNVEGTVNASGSNGLELLRKAPGVQVDNNDNIVVLGRSGVLIYIDGKRLPLSGDQMSNYLSSLQASQIDRIDIISNPGAKYEAEGNAGIIDIRLKRDKNMGANGSLNTTLTQGVHTRGNAQLTGNYRNKKFNVFGNIGLDGGQNFSRMDFYSELNQLVLAETTREQRESRGQNARIGADFFLSEKHTLGFIATGNFGSTRETIFNRISIAPQASAVAIDSVLVANTQSDQKRNNQSYNLNYRFDNGKVSSVNIDLDYGSYKSDQLRDQPNNYYNANESVLLTSIHNAFDTPSDIEIYTAKIDVETKTLGGKLGYGAKFSKVVSDNTFLFYDVRNGSNIRNNRNSNIFLYDEQVTAGYFSYSRSLSSAINMSAGLRAEHTDATGNLTTFDATLQEPPVQFNYLSWFPNLGFTYSKNPIHAWNLNLGRRINRPDYNVLNPFNNQWSQLSYEKGNPFLKPEIVNNVELGYTLAYAFNFKLAYSNTSNQITRLIGPDERDARSSFISWDNLATQKITSFNLSAPFDATKWWSIYLNANASHTNNQADYGNGAVVNVKAFNWNVFQQSTFSLPRGWKAELSGWYSGPGVWGGVFLSDPMYSLDLGIQKKFFHEQLALRLSVSDVTYQSWWSGYSLFNGLRSEGSGKNDSRAVTLNLNYNFGNQEVKSRQRNTGIESEAGRVKG
jgi:iron complex outermembrane recepter protein